MIIAPCDIQFKTAQGFAAKAGESEAGQYPER
jgi:hypothetical protein